MKPPATHITDCGLTGIGAVPYGFHMCHFYSGEQDLLDSLVPYFQAGLRSNERCIWIASDPLPATAIRSRIKKSPFLSGSLVSGQLSVLDAVEWYGQPRQLSTDVDVARWLSEEERALADGYQGLRISGNTSFVSGGEWNRFMDYEKSVTERFLERRILALCSFSLLSCQPVETLDVVNGHHAALDRSGEHWQIFSQAPRLQKPRGAANTEQCASE